MWDLIQPSGTKVILGTVTGVMLPWKLVLSFIKEEIITLKVQDLRSSITWISDHTMLAKDVQSLEGLLSNLKSSEVLEMWTESSAEWNCQQWQKKWEMSPVFHSSFLPQVTSLPQPPHPARWKTPPSTDPGLKDVSWLFPLLDPLRQHDLGFASYPASKTFHWVWHYVWDAVGGSSFFYSPQLSPNLPHCKFRLNPQDSC